MGKIKIAVPVLMYHEVVDDTALPDAVLRKQHGPYYLRREVFRRHLQTFRDKGFAVISLEQLQALMNGSLPPHGRYVVITFDDGYAGNYRYAFPLLKEFGYTATFFVTTGWIGNRDDMMGWEQLKEMSAGGMSIDSHTRSHPFLKQLDPAGVREELVSSRETIAARLSVPARYISLPHGSCPANYAEIARAAGYAGGCSSRAGVNRVATDPFLLRRLAVTSGWSAEFLKKMLLDPWTLRRFTLKSEGKRLVRMALGETAYDRIYKGVFGSARRETVEKP